MTSRVPESLIRTLQKIVDGAGAPLGKQIRALEELFSLFTTERERLRRGSYLDIPRFRNAYLRYHVPLNFARAACALAQVRAVFPEVDRLENVVDLGAGPGSASLATLHALPDAPARRYTLFDRSRAALKVARQLLEVSPDGSGRAPAVQTRTASLPPVPVIPAPSLVWMCMLLNELGIDHRKGGRPGEFVEHVTARTPPGSVLILIEPAQRAPGRLLLDVHDAFVASRAWTVLAPCTHDLTCPLVNIRSRPWCHFHFEWTQHEYVRRVAAPLGLVSTRGSLAFLAVARAGAGAGRPGFGKGARVIGDIMKVQDGKQGVYVCQDGERKVLSPPPRGSRRGDIVEMKADGTHHRSAPWQPIDERGPERRRTRP